MKNNRFLLALILVLALCLSACGGNDSAASDKSATVSSKEDNVETVETVVEEINYKEIAEQEIASGNYHDAFLTLLAWDNEVPGAIDTEEYFDLYSAIDDATAGLEPKSGTELKRTFQFQGGGLLTLNAVSGPVVVTVTDTEEPDQYVRFYVRMGETVEINLPASVYDITYQLGICWFGDEIGFGEVCYEGGYEEPFDFSSSSDNAWITNIHWEVSI